MLSMCEYFHFNKWLHVSKLLAVNEILSSCDALRGSYFQTLEFWNVYSFRDIAVPTHVNKEIAYNSSGKEKKIASHSISDSVSKM